MTNVVVGAGSGMGVAVARKLAPRGPLLVVDRDVESVEKLAEELGPAAHAVCCDITDQAQIDALIEEIDDLAAFVCTVAVLFASASGYRVPDRAELFAAPWGKKGAR